MVVATMHDVCVKVEYRLGSRRFDLALDDDAIAGSAR
jgi:hypothetical protein